MTERIGPCGEDGCTRCTARTFLVGILLHYESQTATELTQAGLEYYSADEVEQALPALVKSGYLELMGKAHYRLPNSLYAALYGDLGSEGWVWGLLAEPNLRSWPVAI